MKKIFLMTAGLMLALAGGASGDVLAGFDFYGQLGNQGASTATVVAAEMSVSTLTRGAGIVASGAAAAYLTNNFTSTGYTATNTLQTAIDSNDYVGFSLVVSNGSSVSFTNLTLGASVRNASSSPGTNALYAVIGGGSPIPLYTNVVCKAVMGSSLSTAYSNFTFNLSGVSQLQNVAAGTTVQFRWYSYGGTAEGNNESIMIGRERNTVGVLDLFVEGVTDSGIQHTLTVNANPGGSATGGGLYKENANPQIVATASNGFFFVNWTGAVTSVNSTTNVLMTTNKTVWANFAPEPIKATTFTLE